MSRVCNKVSKLCSFIWICREQGLAKLPNSRAAIKWYSTAGAIVEIWAYSTEKYTWFILYNESSAEPPTNVVIKEILPFTAFFAAELLWFFSSHCPRMLLANRGPQGPRLCLWNAILLDRILLSPKWVIKNVHFSLPCSGTLEADLLWINFRCHFSPFWSNDERFHFNLYRITQTFFMLQLHFIINLSLFAFISQTIRCSFMHSFVRS